MTKSCETCLYSSFSFNDNGEPDRIFAVCRLTRKRGGPQLVKWHWGKDCNDWRADV